jgi:zinc D-Ala-D-Ala carboxypeptidase
VSDRRRVARAGAGVPVSIPLSRNFSLRELTKSQMAIRNGIDNAPTAVAIDALVALARNILQPTRDHFAKPVVVSSGFRTMELERILCRKRISLEYQKGGDRAVESYLGRKQHPRGEAADFEIFGVPNIALAHWIYDNLDADQVILEFYDDDDPAAGWVHASFAAGRANRHQSLTITADGLRDGLPSKGD